MPKLLKMGPQSEREVERLILQWLNLQPNCKAWKNVSAGTWDATKKVFRSNRGPYSQNGSSDILGIWQGKMLCIEVKFGRNKASNDQQNFINQMQDLGAIAFIAYSLNEVIDKLSNL